MPAPLAWEGSFTSLQAIIWWNAQRMGGQHQPGSYSSVLGSGLRFWLSVRVRWSALSFQPSFPWKTLNVVDSLTVALINGFAFFLNMPSKLEVPQASLCLESALIPSRHLDVKQLTAPQTNASSCCSEWFLPLLWKTSLTTKTNKQKTEFIGFLGMSAIIPTGQRFLCHLIYTWRKTVPKLLWWPSVSCTPTMF